MPVIRDADPRDRRHRLRDARAGGLLPRRSADGRVACGGTFTVTDLSGESVAAFHPLISRARRRSWASAPRFPARYPPGRSIWSWGSITSSPRAGRRAGSSASSASGSRPTKRRSPGRRGSGRRAPLLAVPGGLSRVGGQRTCAGPVGTRGRFGPAALQTLLPGMDMIESPRNCSARRSPSSSRWTRARSGRASPSRSTRPRLDLAGGAGFVDPPPGRAHVAVGLLGEDLW